MSLSYMNVYPNVYPEGMLPSHAIEGDLDSYWTQIPTQPHIHNIAIKNFSSASTQETFTHSDEDNGFSFLIGRLKLITITLGKKTSFTLDQFLTDPEIRAKALKKIQRMLQKKIEQTWRTFLLELEALLHLINKKRLKDKLSCINGGCKVFQEIGKYQENSLDIIASISNLISTISKVTTFGDKIKEWHENGFRLKIEDLLKSDLLNTVSTVIDSVHDIVALPTALIDFLDSNDFMKMAYEAIGFGKEFSPF